MRALASGGLPSVSFDPPSLPTHALPRAQLERRIGPADAARLSLVTGPAGAGKTTLVRLWVSRLHGRWAWMTVDSSVGRREMFWRGFVRAVQIATPETVLDAADAISDDAVDGELVARAIADDLLDIPVESGPVVIVVDDAHLIDSDTWRDLRWLITHQPSALHLVLVSRSDPPFPIARLRSLGHVTEVRQQDLAFSRAETHELVQQHLGSDAVDHISDALYERTEGWAAGIRLALISLEHGSDAADILTRRDEAHGFVSELLISEALDRLPSDLCDFLAKTSVVTLLEPRLCDTLTGRSDSREVLRRLAHGHVFVTALQDRDDCYRFHPLFADVLRVELRASGPDAEATQHRLASLWYETECRYADAVEQALAGSDHETAFGLIVGHLPELYGEGQRQAVGRWLLDVPDAFIRDDPERAVAHCAALLFVVRPEWLRWLERARTVVGNDRPDLRARLELFEALRWCGRGDLERMERHVARARSLRPDGAVDPFDEVIDAWRARLLVLHGDTERALRIVRDLRDRPRQLIRDLPAISLLAAISFAAGEADATVLTRDAISEWRALGEPDYLGMADALCVGAELALVEGELEEAENLAAGAGAVSRDRPIHLLGVRSEIALARVESASGRADDAWARLCDVRLLVDQIGVDPSVVALVDTELAAIADARSLDRLGAASTLVDPLTERELIILGELAGHRTYPEIGRELFISRHTVKTHVSRIYRKLGVAGRSDAIEAATVLGILPR